MKHKTLYEIIKYLQYGTNLHIGVIFFNNYGNEMCKLPKKHEIHSRDVCETFKGMGRKGFKRCFKCRNLAIKKALNEKKAFGGICLNGVYEYTHPVLVGDKVSCIIYVGNILDKEKGLYKLKPYIDEKGLSTLESDFGIEKCQDVCSILESYIIMLFDEYGYTSEKDNPLIENIKSYIDSNLEFDIKISDITRFFHYNNQYIGRLFKNETGYTITEYINHQRINRSKKLLKNTSDTVISISNKVGFNNVTYFNRLFKKETTLTPEEYRKLKQK